MYDKTGQMVTNFINFFLIFPAGEFFIGIVEVEQTKERLVEQKN
jgi:hypothetical protein